VVDANIIDYRDCDPHEIGVSQLFSDGYEVVLADHSVSVCVYIWVSLHRYHIII
jgi:hypothetical protein